jgi:uncharacterized protein
MKIFYHNDMDGVVSASWVYLSVGITESLNYMDDSNNVCFSMDYQNEFPIKIVRKDEQVYIVDFSIQPEEMIDLLKITKNVTWIDHHETAINKYKDILDIKSIRGIRKSGIAACMLTYCYLHHMTSRGEGDIKAFSTNMIENAPMDTKLVADYDVWDFKYGDDTTYFKLWFDSVNLSPEEYLDTIRFNSRGDNITSFIQIGKSIKSYVDAQHKYNRETFAYVSEFDGHKCLVCNRKDNSWLFGEYIDEFDFVVSCVFNGEKWISSLFSKKENINVGEICKKYGGGGHKGAAGFISDKFMFTKYLGKLK